MIPESINRETGEVKTLSDAEARDLAEAIARDLVAMAPALADARREVGTLDARRVALEDDLRRLGVTRADGGSHYAVLVPPKRGAQRVDRQVAQRERETLLTLGLGHEQMAYHPPTISAIRAARAELIAAGVDLDALAPEPVAGPATVQLVPRPS